MSSSPRRTTSTDSYVWRTSSRSSQPDALAVDDPEEFGINLSLAKLYLQSRKSQETNESLFSPNSVFAEKPLSVSEDEFSGSRPSEDIIIPLSTSPTTDETLSADEDTFSEKVELADAKVKKICCTIL